MRDGGFGLLHEREIPSFSSSLLDVIYRSIDEEGGSDLPREQGFYANLVSGKKKSKCCVKAGEVDVFDRIESLKTVAWVEKRDKERETIQRRQVYPKPEKKPWRDCDFDHNALFFSSTSSSSESSSNGFSSSDTESAYGGMKTRVSCFAPLPRPKLVWTSGRQDRTGANTEFSPFQEQRKLPGFDGGNEGMINSKSRALKIYSNFKKMKQPISPVGKLASFINTLFAVNNTPRKAKQTVMSAMPYSKEEENLVGKFKPVDSSACTSASSFSRSCLSKYSPTTREKLRNVSKRTVQFYPVSVILDKDSRPCGEKSLHQEHEESEKENVNRARSVSFPFAQNPGMNVHRKITDETRHNNLWMDRSSKAEEAAREFLRNYHRNQKKIEKTTPVTSRGNYWNRKKDDDRGYEDDAASCSSSDLFELDHLSVLGNDICCEELPVYGTTRVGLIM